MSRKREERLVRQSDAQMQEHIENSLRNIKSLCGIYDEGQPFIAFSLANEIHKFLTAGNKVNAVRGDRLFPSVDFAYSERNILPEHKLIASRVYRDHVEFRPVLEGVKGVLQLKFRDWWNRETIYRAGAGTDPTATLHPLPVTAQVPRDKRKILTRRTFIELVRNKLGAHLDSELPETLDALQRANAMGINILVNLGDRVLSTVDGTLPMTVGPAAAMVRQIGHELLTALKEQERKNGS